MSDSLEEVVVAHRDRLRRFAFELVEQIFQLKNVKLTVLDGNNCALGKATEIELANDILSIVHVYSCR
jgi:predicted site-specific integrase-resolvase